MLRVIFFGTPTIAAELLADLLEQHVCEIVGVVTRPDKPKGRSKKPVFSPVKDLAQARNLPLLQANRCHQPESLDWLRALKADIFLVVAFGEILRAQVLEIPPQGCWNVHASLLPAYRGAAPMQWALRNGDRVSGICLQKMVLACDAGDIALQAQVEIPENMNRGELESSLITAAKPLLSTFFHELETGSIHLTSQNEEAVTWAPKIEAEDCQIDWNASPQVIHNLIRSCDPEPGAYSWFSMQDECKRLRILKSRIPQDPISLTLEKPGQSHVFAGRLLISTLGGWIEILSVQPEGKRPMSAKDFLNGMRGQCPLFFSTENPNSP